MWNVPHLVLLAYLVRFRYSATYNEPNNTLKCIRSWSCVTSSSLNMGYNALSVLVSLVGYHHSPLACTTLVKFSNHPPTTTCIHTQYSYKVGLESALRNARSNELGLTSNRNPGSWRCNFYSSISTKMNHVRACKHGTLSF